MLGFTLFNPTYKIKLILFTQAKPEKRNHWGSRLLSGMKVKGKPKKASPGQMSLPWDGQKVTESTEVEEVARKFVTANCYNPPVPGNEKLQC
ncbi:MAG TPA: hypothetical protein VK203_01500 [Nostocaceae cyanobacterium]|nr:hypothetical protein [Nostocaceae cyanobacterium]